MADYWLINPGGKADKMISRRGAGKRRKHHMTRKRRHSRRHSRRHHRNPESHRTRVMAARRSSRRRYHRNPVTMSGWGGKAVSALVILGSYAVSKKVADMAASKLPVPAIAVNVGVPALVALGAGMVIRDSRIKEAAQVGAIIALAMAVLPDTVKQSVGLEAVKFLPAPAASSMGAQLAARLSAELRDNAETYQAEY